MLDDLVQRAPQEHVLRHRNDRNAVVSQHPVDVRERGQVVVDVFDHVERDDHVELTSNLPLGDVELNELDVGLVLLGVDESF
ncbi:hypothetical protein D9M72_601800 [compost metagenome]